MTSTSKAEDYFNSYAEPDSNSSSLNIELKDVQKILPKVGS